MPELPEVETTLRTLLPALHRQRIERVIVRERRLRWPIPRAFDRISGLTVAEISRRAKYLLFQLDDDRDTQGFVLAHLGMTGVLSVVPREREPEKHDHFDLWLSSGGTLRFRDPRRFGSVHWIKGDRPTHPLLAALGPEPLEPAFSADYLYDITRNRAAPVKNVLMDQSVVVGVGNIYASEALFQAGIHPSRPARRISRERYQGLIDAVRATLTKAIALGGASIRDYRNGAGESGYFQTETLVYDRAGLSCVQCGTAIRRLVLGQRASYYCPSCQK